MGANLEGQKKIIPFGDPLNEGEISEIEKILGCRLPDDYRSFLLKIGGGMFDGNAGVEIEAMSLDVFEIHGRNKDRTVDVTSAASALRLGNADSFFPPQSIIFADDIFGKSYFAIISDDKMEIRWMGYLPEADSLHVANSFTEFLDMITVTPYED